jgi:AcrR family transcriptional regulator
LFGLTREKAYGAIAVKDILDRADVGRSTFYTHFEDKDDLLASGVRQLLESVRARPRAGSPAEQLVGFSRPILEHIDGHRRGEGPPVTPTARRVMHDRLRDTLADMLEEDLAGLSRRRPQLPLRLVAQHLASTFVLVLDTWVERDSGLTPAEVDARFRALVLPVIATL